MSSPSYAKSLASLTKRLKLSSSGPTLSSTSSLRCLHQSVSRLDGVNTTPEGGRRADLPPVKSLSPSQLEKELQGIRLPRAVQATYLTPLRRKAEHEDPVCNLQLRSYSVRNLEVFADFAMRAAYYLNMPAKGPIPLPRITERWTVPRSNFIFKKSQENFERITVRRLIQIQDANPETVSMWLSFLQKHRYYGIGMKANLFEHSSLDEFDNLDVHPESQLGEQVQTEMSLLKTRRTKLDSEDAENMLEKEIFKGAWGGHTAPMASAQSIPSANTRTGGQPVLSAEYIKRRHSVSSAHFKEMQQKK